MESGFFSTVFYQPIYNTLVFFLSVVPGANVGVAIILLTITVRTVLFPLFHKQTVSQAKMRAITPHVEKLKEKHKDDKQVQAQKVMELYREHGINPLSGCLPILIQLPVLFALYFVLFKGLPSLSSNLLYSFVHLPETLDMTFLGTLLSGKSAFFAALAAVVQYYQIKLSIPPVPAPEKGTTPSFKDEFARSFSTQARYLFPVLIFIFAYSTSAAIGLYLMISNLFSVGQELYVKRKAVELMK